MFVTGLVLAGVAAIVHVFIFYLESIAWTSKRARATFGTSEQEAETTKALAFNQGFYNLFLAIAVTVGIVLVAAGARVAGATLVFAGETVIVKSFTVTFTVVLWISTPCVAVIVTVLLSTPDSFISRKSAVPSRVRSPTPANTE